MAINELLFKALEDLDSVAKNHEEIFDSEVRERIGVAVMDGFVRQQGVGAVPADLGLATVQSNEQVRRILVNFIDRANNEASSTGLLGFHDRLNALQDRRVVTTRGNDYEEYFGHTPSEFYDVIGNVIRWQ